MPNSRELLYTEPDPQNPGRLLVYTKAADGSTHAHQSAPASDAAYCAEADRQVEEGRKHLREKFATDNAERIGLLPEQV